MSRRNLKRRNIERSEIYVQDVGGYGGTATKIKYYSNVIKKLGKAITYVSDTTNGDSFVANEPGFYHMLICDQLSGAGSCGISLNSTQLTTNGYQINQADIVLLMVPQANSPSSGSTILWLNIGDVIRVHGDGTSDGSNPSGDIFRMIYLGKGWF